MKITFNQLIPEFSVSNLDKSLKFYINILGFSIVYKRSEEGFAFLKLGKAQLMLDQLGLSRDWITAKLEKPYGRGVSLQIKLQSIKPILTKLKKK